MMINKFIPKNIYIENILKVLKETTKILMHSIKLIY